MTTPDQPTGMNELREKLADLCWLIDAIRPSKFRAGDKIADIYASEIKDAEAAIQQIVERCIPEKRTGDIRFGTRGERTFHESDYDQGCNYALAKLRHNLQQAGLLRGDAS